MQCSHTVHLTTKLGRGKLLRSKTFDSCVRYINLSLNQGCGLGKNKKVTTDAALEKRSDSC